ncbi:SUMF1/EgtB/PvdO family nonheme iron enzyme [Novosphingobium sp.]|uniref:SUMF1/EgtB/PvdO family nonheme iron enzyme n=1 Tax=Novosphingobium sp. TaxID=1874826 RepID=UPI003B52686F
MRQAFGLLCALLAMLCLGGSDVAASATRAPRLALVIANGAYANYDHLAKTGVDGDRVAAALGATGFTDASGAATVQVNRDLTLAQMQAKVAEFREKLAAAGPEAFGVLYFSGHGAALSSFGDPALVPTDADRQLTAGSLSLTRAYLTRTLLGSGAKNILIVLDMCRNVVAASAVDAPAAPLADAGVGVQAGSKGLRRLIHQSDGAFRPDQGYLVAFSTSPDQVAFDDGTFSRVFAEEIRRPQQNIADALKRTSDRVAVTAVKASKALQKPTFDYGLQGSPPCFVSCDLNNQDRFYDCANCPYMRVIPAGTARLGSPLTEPRRQRDEPVQHDVAIDRPFAMGVYAVTISEWAACVRDKACRAISDWSKENPNPSIPVTGISFEDAQGYVAWLSVQSGLPYQLPTETQWEYADRAGAATVFPWGDAITPGDANYDQTASYHGSPTAPYRGYPEAVGAYPPNAFGLYQMNGNAWTWTQGCADQPCRSRILRGGSFQSAPEELRAANRFAADASRKRDDAGLRVVRELSPDEALH